MTAGGFVSDPAEAFSPAGAGGCCGAPVSAEAAAPSGEAVCCGTTAEVAAECCGPAPTVEEVAAGANRCCG